MSESKHNLETLPFCVQLTRGQRGAYGWQIRIEGRDKKTVLRQIDETDTHLREKYLREKPAAPDTAQVDTPPTAPITAPEMFPKDLAELLTLEEGEDGVIVRPRQFLGAEVFAKVAAIVKEKGGYYVSAGKDSHFRLPRAKEAEE